MSPRTAAARERRASRARAVHRHLMQFGEHESLATPVWEASGTSVSAIGTRLAELWNVGTEEAGETPWVTEKGLPHARASVLNLIVVVVDEAAAQRVVHTMLTLGSRHPSRAIVLVADHDADAAALDARISTHCHPSADGDERVCYEEVVLSVHGEAAEHLDGIVAPILIHDLPIHVWWPGNPPFADPVFNQLVEMGDRLIVDSSDFDDLLLGMRRLATTRRRSGVGDLTWRRLAWWQELTAQFFDAPRFRRYLPNLSRLHVRYAVAPPRSRGRRRDRTDVAPGVRSPLAAPLLYAGWIASRLGWRRHRTVDPLRGGRLRLRLEGRYEMVDLLIEPVETADVPPGELVSVHLGSLGETGAAEFIVDREGDLATVASNADGMTALLRRVTMEPISEAEVLSADLVMDRNEPVFESALRAAAVFLDAARSSSDGPARASAEDR
ncbi:MAG TPA: glucose-6-phosphate dehydrogenase assembly protein OpcA [Candidatus Limnocylindria bacterium]|nr:glucose-6-phosphate dehydrogenase assembly protein OpcA [Candidatus Limnocylindria bacterium]